jgi:hypothetical protein
LSISKVSIFPKSLNQVLLSYFAQKTSLNLAPNWYHWFIVPPLLWWSSRTLTKLKSQSQKSFKEQKYQYLKYKNKNHSGTYGHVKIIGYQLIRDKLEIKQGSFIQQTQYFIPVEIDLSIVPARLGISDLFTSWLVPSDNP